MRGTCVDSGRRVDDAPVRVFDTNVLVSGLLSPFGPPRRLLEGLLTRIDAAVLGAYDLPARLEQRPSTVSGLGAPGCSCVAPLGRPDSGPRPHPGEAAVGARGILDVFRPLPPTRRIFMRPYGV